MAQRVTKRRATPGREAGTAKKGFLARIEVSRRTLAVGSFALFLALAFTFLVWMLKPSGMWDWLITFAATLISVIAAVALFWYQRDKNDNERQEQLLIALAAEARACLRTLDEPPAPISTLRDNREIARAVLAPLPTAVLDETIRSGLHDPQDSYNLIFMARALEAHNSDIATALSMQTVEVKTEAFLLILERIKQRQDAIRGACERLVENLEALGLPLPEMHSVHSENPPSRRLGE